MLSLNSEVNAKNVLLGLLSAYVAADILMSLMMKKSIPSCIENLVKYAGTQEGLMVIILAILVGFIVYCMSSKKECFTKEKLE